MPKSDKDSIRKRNYMPFFTYERKNTTIFTNNLVLKSNANISNVTWSNKVDLGNTRTV